MTGRQRYRVLVDLATCELSARAGDVLELAYAQAYRILRADPAVLVREPDAPVAAEAPHQWVGSHTR